MTKTIEINVPKPGDILPFVIAEWEHKGNTYSLEYEFVEGEIRLGSNFFMDFTVVELLASFLGIPATLPVGMVTVGFRGEVPNEK